MLAWLARHPRVHIHYAPTSSSWLNLVERFFGEITRDCIRDGSFSSVAELERANDEYIAARNESPRPFVWLANGEEVLATINRARRSLGMQELDTAPEPHPARTGKRNRKKTSVGKLISESAH